MMPAIPRPSRLTTTGWLKEVMPSTCRSSQGTERPLYAGYLENGSVVRLYQYVQYDLGLEPDPTLFVPPPGIIMKEAAP